MELLDVIGVLEEATAEGSEYTFVLVKTNSSEEMVIIPADKFDEKKSFYEENFDENGMHKTYPGIALLAASHGDATENLRLRKEYYNTENEQPLLPPEETDPEEEV